VADGAFLNCESGIVRFVYTYLLLLTLNLNLKYGSEHPNINLTSKFNLPTAYPILPGILHLNDTRLSA
jgi:hypothetical protein